MLTQKSEWIISVCSKKSEWISVCSKTNQTSLIMKLFPPHIAILSEMAAWCQTESNLKLSNSISLFRSLQLLYIFQVLSITNSISFPSHHQYLIWAKWSDSERQKFRPQVPSTVARRRNEKALYKKTSTFHSILFVLKSMWWPFHLKNILKWW